MRPDVVTNGASWLRAIDALLAKHMKAKHMKAKHEMSEVVSAINPEEKR